jgi:hypothetical protein
MLGGSESVEEALQDVTNQERVEILPVFASALEEPSLH